MKARVFNTVMLVVSLALIAVSGRSEAAPPTLGKPVGVASFRCANVTQIPMAECDALAALYTTTNGSNWSNIPGGKYWLSTDTPCDDWFGITCSGGHVTELRLGSNNNLSGAIPQDLRHLTHLTVLDLGHNKLNGWIPSARILDGALPAEVQIRKNGNDAVNEWSHKDPNTEYDFHRKSEPYVPPSSASKLATLNPLSTAYTDEGALAFEGSYFYIVQSRFNDVTADSNETAAFTYALVKGIEEQDSLPTGASR